MGHTAISRYIQEEIEALIETHSGTPLSRARRLRLAAILERARTKLQNPTRSDEFSSQQVTILLADLRGFSYLSRTHPIAVVLEVLNDYLSQMSKTILREGGTIDKFMGDSVMAYFGGPKPEQAVRAALRCALKMQLSMDALNRRYRRRGLPELFMGIGIHTGTVMAGKVGSVSYSEHTMIGDDVNLVSRIEAFSLRGQILVSERTFQVSNRYITTQKPIEVDVKGREVPVFLREVQAIPSERMKVPQREIRRSVRVKADLPLTYRIVNDKIVEKKWHRGRVVDVSYFGLQAELAQALPMRSEIKLTLDLPLVGYKANDIYAKVTRVRETRNHVLTSLEIGSASTQSLAYMRRFVQLLLQGSERV